MKSVLIIFTLVYACGRQPVPDVASATDPEQQTVSAEPLVFEKDIQPILESHCRPCHFKDGKMYQRMPFDQSKKLVDFQEGILRRMKDEKEATKIREYLAQQ